jgi:hypothetical protein
MKKYIYIVRLSFDTRYRESTLFLLDLIAILPIDIGRFDLGLECTGG